MSTVSPEVRYLAACLGGLMAFYAAALILHGKRAGRGLVKPPGGPVAWWVLLLLGLAILVVSLFAGPPVPVSRLP